jgi:hypothetical protein
MAISLPGMVASMLVMAISLPGMVASMLVMAISVPAKFGARSLWLENTPDKPTIVQ